ncbi:hypothetical protein LJK88_33640 [Paenibacillus sp. P26]|nr:hypothetical protein LJK88_33640 [Paenibacillus sp. P26]
MLLAGHFALSARMPDIARFDIPMGQLLHGLGLVLPTLFILVIYGEIFTTFLSDVYGLALQVEQRTKRPISSSFRFFFSPATGSAKSGLSR